MDLVVEMAPYAHLLTVTLSWGTPQCLSSTAGAPGLANFSHPSSPNGSSVSSELWLKATCKRTSQKPLQDHFLGPLLFLQIRSDVGQGWGQRSVFLIAGQFLGKLYFENCLLLTSRMYLIQIKKKKIPCQSSGHAGRELNRLRDGAAGSSLQQVRCQLHHLWVG